MGIVRQFGALPTAAHNGGMQMFTVSVAALLLAGCASSANVGLRVPLGPVSVGVGVGSGGPSVGVHTGWGPVGAGVGVRADGQVTGQAGIGGAVPLGGGVQAGVGVGTSTVLRAPSGGAAGAASAAPPMAQQPARGPVEWRDAQGRVVPACRVHGGC